MRRLLALGVLALGMLLAATAQADVRRGPLRVQWVGPPPTLETGKPVTGGFRFLSSNPVEITDIRIEGAGWSTRLVDSPGRASLAKPGRFDVRFEANGQDLSRPITVRFRENGVERTQTFDLRAVAAAAQPGAARSVPPADDSFLLLGQKFARPEAASPEDGAAVWGKTDRLVKEPAEPQRVSARSIRVHGRFVYTRSDAAVLGADGVAIYIYDEDTGVDELVGSGVTDAYGYYDITFTWDPCWLFCDSEPDLYVQFVASNSKVTVKDAGGSTYSWVSGTTSDYTGTDLDVGWLTPSDEGQHPALNVLTDLTRDWRWYINRAGRDQPHVDAYWPEPTTGAWYDDGSETLHFGTDRGWREDSHAHEYGHHFIYNFAVGQTPDYCNGICDGALCGHCLWCQETNHDAWNEGWPDWICHVQTSSYASDYGTASINTRNMETVQPCTSTLDDPTITEGFLGALLQDIWDSSNEDDGNAPGTWMDRLSMGYDEILTCTTSDLPLNPLDFITKFKNRYPAYKEQIWETAKNNTYEVDAANPSAVTSLTSPSHAVGSSLPDPTVDFTWTRAADDWSGPSGYSITVQSTAGLPDAVQDIGDVTSYTTGVLAPGTYRFNIRTKDRSGKWGAGYATYGPFTIRAPEPANVTYHTFSGWSKPTLPRSTNDATFTNCPDPVAPLTSDVSTTYWNVGGINNGESSTSTGFQCRAYVDNTYKTGATWPSVGAGGGFVTYNFGPFTAGPGRHTFETRYDALDAIAETDETDNLWAHQWIWMPTTLTVNTTTTRSAPPFGDAGWSSIVDGSTAWFNADGLRFATNVGGWWNAVYVYATNLDEDYDCRLHFPTASADTGFAANHGYSARSAGYLDAVIVNRNTMSTPNTWDVGVLNRFEGTSSYVTRHVTSSILSFGDSVNVTLDTGVMMLLREFYLYTADTGYVSITAKIVSGTGPVYLQWRNQAFSLGALSSATSQATADGSTTARIDAHMTTSGWQGIALYRDPVDGTDPVTVVLEISTTPPDMLAYDAPGWYSPFTPRPANDGTPASVPQPDTLYGNVASTYLNFSVRNDSPTPAPSFSGYVDIDGVYSVGLGYGGLGAYANNLFNWGSGRTIRGGRHTLSVYYDQGNLIEERFETNNWFGEQYVWGPYLLTMNSPVTRSAPPDRTGGWTEVPTGTLWYNSDGLRFPKTAFVTGNYYWQAVSVMPGAASDVDVRLHDLVPGTTDGFATNHGVSGWGTGQSDYCLVNFNGASVAAYDAGILNVAGTQSYTAEFVGSTFTIAYPSGIYGPYTLAANHTLRLHEFYLGTGTYAVDLFNVSGTVNWGLTVHAPTPMFQTKSTSATGGHAWLGGPGENELCTVTIPANGYYCVAVWKAGSADLPLAGTYTLQVRPLTTAVDDVPPVHTGLSGVFPNPMGPATSVGFDLATGSDVRLELFDLHGARVKTLAQGRWEAGRWHVEWNGVDDAGRRAPPGVYFLQLQTRAGIDSRRLVLLH